MNKKKGSGSSVANCDAIWPEKIITNAWLSTCKYVYVGFTFMAKSFVNATSRPFYLCLLFGSKYINNENIDK